MTATGTAEFLPDWGSPPAGQLVPLLPVEENAPDPVALGTWYLALAATTAVEVPHDLLALWLFPVTGGVVLLGPSELAQDEVPVPVPERRLLQDQLFQLEEILRRARYESAIAVPIRHGDRDVGVMVLGSFAKATFGPVQALALKRLAARLSNALGRLAEVMPAPTPHPMLDAAVTVEALPAHIAQAAADAATGPDLVRRVSGVLHPLLPHDRLEILAASGHNGSFVPLSGKNRRRWGGNGGMVEPFAAIVGRFGSGPTLLIDDLTDLDEDGAWTVGGPGSTIPARGVLAARMQVAGGWVGYLVLGSVARDAYRPEDEEILASAALLVATRVAGFRLAAEAAALRTQVQAADTPALPLIRSAEALAATSHLGDALAAFFRGLRELVPHDGVSLHLRWGEDEVIELNPEAPRPFADIPATSIEAVAGTAVLRGEKEWLAQSVPGGEGVTVPLVVAGRIIGTLGVWGTGFESPGDTAAVTRQFANILAPHLELLRRGAAANAPGGRASAERRSLIGEV